MGWSSKTGMSGVGPRRGVGFRLGPVNECNRDFATAKTEAAFRSITNQYNSLGDTGTYWD
jgi:hypothetical protein